MPRNCSIWASMEISSSSMKSKSTSRRPPPGPVWSPPLGKNTTALIHKHFHNDKDPFFFSFSDRLIFPCFFTSLNLHRETKQWTTEQLHGSTLCTTSSLCPQNAPLTPPPQTPCTSSSTNSSAAGQMCVGHRGAERSYPAPPREFRIHLVLVFRGPQRRAPHDGGLAERLLSLVTLSGSSLKSF